MGPSAEEMHRDAATRPANQAGAAAVLVLLIAGVTVAAFLHALDLASRLAQTSDSAQSLVAAHAVLKGNPLLSGWHFPVDNYYFTDTIPYAALEWFLGPKRYLLVTVPAATYAFLVLVACVSAAVGRESVFCKIWGVATVAFLLVCPSWIGRWNPLLFSGFHVGSTLAAIVAVSLCVAGTQISRPPAVLIGVALVLVTASTVASDPFSLVFAFGPAAAVLAFDASRRNGAGAQALVLLVCGIAAGLLLPAVAAAAGDSLVTENTLAVGFANPSQVAENVIALLCGLLLYFGGNIFAPYGGAGLFLGIRLLAFLLAVIATATVGWRLARPRPTTPLFDRILCAGVLSLVTACAFSAKFGSEVTPQSVWSGSASIRYLVPAVFFAGILAGRRIPPAMAAVPVRAVRDAMFAVLAVLAAVAILAGDWPSRITESWSSWIDDNPSLRVARWLAAHGYKQGVGDYWSANLITALSEATVQVRSVRPFRDKLYPHWLVSDSRAYGQSPQFAVWNDANLSGVTWAAVRESYGICALVTVADYRIAILRDATNRSPCSSGSAAEGKAEQLQSLDPF